MWFKQAQIFQLPASFKVDLDSLCEHLNPLAFTPCLPSLPMSVGWVPPVEMPDTECPLVREVGGAFLFSLQFEEKILPASVISQHVLDKIKKIEQQEDRKVRQKEKLSIKDDVTVTLMPRAFTKFAKVSAYIDPANRWLVINTTSAARQEKAISMLRKCFDDDLDVKQLSIDNLGAKLTRRLMDNDFTTEFDIEKRAVFQDPNQENRVIRCQHQNLFADSIVSLIKDGCRVKQMALTWQDQITFVITDTLSLSSISYEDELLATAKDLELETKDQVFDANMMIMTKTLSHLLHELFNILNESVAERKEERVLEEA